ncbi:hypothetical protein AAY86_18470 [Pseudomonas amygdali pv. tabaci str. ATCC 11528]|uniref:hypothetical protein n=1 Tax=Pseudomonas amygdali TaxID=47877 RepID=UPI00062B4FC9|nr:hypothetical protein [Pseudomonas amygdali]KKY51474.1 hypothetical protein AAY86_18470 [Pseudomonas amygdali pv. tabaci str. ATCC 11528]
MDEEKVITPFELGVLAALQLVGKAIALNPHIDIDALKRDADGSLSLLPSEPKWAGNSPAIYRAAIESLLTGIDLVKR